MTRDGQTPRRRGAATVVMIGAGQLARMTHQAAVSLGVTLHVVAERADDPAVLAGAPFTLAAPADLERVVEAARGADALTLDHELVPAEVLGRIAEIGVPVHPSPSALRYAQDKLEARRRFFELGLPVPAFSAVATAGDVAAFADSFGWPLVVKARRGGYDGRGVHFVASPEDAKALLGAGAPGEPAFVVEEHLDLASEFAILAARRPSGEVASYPPIATLQVDGICNELTMPAELGDSSVAIARDVATRLLGAIGAVGIAAVEFFAVRDGRILINEIALRPHNSGHATIEAASTSQFEQHLRAVLDWPLGSTDLYRPAAMVNVIGTSTDQDPLDHLEDALKIPGIHVHLYEKAPRAGRKLGHVTALGDDVDDALDRARAAAIRLAG